MISALTVDIYLKMGFYPFDFYLILCLDTLLEILGFGNRRQLTKLERIGRRFHRCCEIFFEGKPFIRLNLEIMPRLAFFFNFQSWQTLIAFKITFVSVMQD